MMIAKLRRTQFGRSSEQLEAMIDQLQLSLEELQVSQAEMTPSRRAGTSRSFAP